MTLVIFAFVFWLVSWRLNFVLANSAASETRLIKLVVPVIFGSTILVIWELVVRGLNVPLVILPPPSVIADTFLAKWFGFDWHSKAAVVVVMVFFPMLINTVAGLSETTAMQRDLMKTYNADPWQAFIKLRLPAAMPFIFNGLKISTTLALIGAIVAEFFGSPTLGMGFRISASIGQLALDMVWAEIVVAAIAGSAFYGIVAIIEKGVTFWHPSQRG
ncbi:MAG: ABC transporter permease subunit [Rhodobacteraceae bacterium]|nr:ABC transporter permease subunit [Paracoccaceae bacterium]